MKKETKTEINIGDIDMIETLSDNSLKNFTNQKITKVTSIIITTDVGNIILVPCKDTTVSLTQTKNFGLLDCLMKKEATIETEYDNMIIVK